MRGIQMSKRKTNREEQIESDGISLINIIIPVLVVVIIVVAGLALRPVLFPSSGGDNVPTGNNPSSEGTSSGNPTVTMVTSEGTIVMEVYKDKVPTTADNFLNLAKSGFYDGLIFHRVIDNFMIQTGGYEPGLVPKQSPYGPIPLEINKNLTHVDGAVGMARTNDPNSATSQFYICDGPQHSLDGQYAVFAQVTSGMDVVRNIAAVQTHTVQLDPNNPNAVMKDVPVNDITIISMTVSP